MIGQTVSHYRIIGELGTGGTGVVYLAEDVRLRRQVALKLLRPFVFADPEAVERFRREARLTSALRHPHICTIHDVGEHDGRQFIVMERLEGVTLDRLIAAGPLPLDRLGRIAIDVAEALQAAHENGIVHRDIKPRNIFVTARGEAKVMDFGLAKAIVGASGEADETRTAGGVRPDLTVPGLALGTIAYMAPEQARGRGVDARADLFSFGAVLYEMATGQRAFRGENAAVVFDRILNHPAPAAGDLNPALPAALLSVLDRALQKNREDRYPSAAALLADLTAMAGQRLAVEGGGLGGPATGAPALRRPRALAVGSAIGLLAAATATGAWLWVHGSRHGPLGARDAVVLGQFVNSTNEPVFDDTLRHALAANLSHSRLLDIVGDERVSSALRLMGRSPDTPLDPPVAREVCQRQGAKAVIHGAIARRGERYHLALAAAACDDGRALAREEADVGRKEDVLTTVAALTASLRASLGDSLATVRSATVPAEQATTPSIEALKAYTQGIQRRAQGAELDAIAHFERAVALDPHFASAYNALSTIYGSAGDTARGAEYARKAFAERGYVTERERLSITFQYHDRVEGDLEKAIATLTLWERSYPRDYSPSNSLALIYNRIGQYERAVEHAREAIARNPNHPFPYSNLAYALRGLNRWADARRTALEAVERRFETLPTRRLLYQIAVLAGDSDAAARHLDAAKGSGREFDMVGAQAQIAAFQGRRREARLLFERTEDMARQGRLADVANGYALQAAWTELLLGSAQDAADRASPLLQDRDQTLVLGAVTVLALSGRTARLAEIVDATARRAPDDTLAGAVFVPMARAALAMAGGDPHAAVRALEPASPYELGRMAGLAPTWLRGTAMLRAGDGARAAAEFRRILEHRGVEPFSIFYLSASAGLAESLALSGDREGARNAYEALFVHWKQADPDLPALQTARARRAALDARG